DPVSSPSHQSSPAPATDDSRVATGSRSLSHRLGWLRLIEDAVASLALLVMAVLPLAEMISRRALGRGIPGSGPIVQHLTLWVGFLGAAIAAREGKLLALATGTLIPPGAGRRAADVLGAAFGACAASVLAV